jgi:hypothetical protein
LYKTECIRGGSPFRDGPLETVADVEKITSQPPAFSTDGALGGSELSPAS